VATVRVEGVAFELADAAEFAERARQQSAGASRPGLSSWTTLAVQLEQRVADGGGDVTLTDGEKRATSAVLGEWRQSKERPDGVDVLYLLLSPG
jgi:hypothetical protein